MGQIWPSRSAGTVALHGHEPLCAVFCPQAGGQLACGLGAFIESALGRSRWPEDDNGWQSAGKLPGRQRTKGIAMPWFPDFISAAELARRQTRAAGQADPVAQYITAHAAAAKR